MDRIKLGWQFKPWLGIIPCMTLSHSKYYHVAGITIKVSSDRAMGTETFHPKLSAFETKPAARPDVLLHHHFFLPDTRTDIFIPENMIYKKFSWEIYRKHTDWYYKFIPSTSTDSAYTVYAVFNDRHTRGSVYTTEIDEKTYASGRFTSLTLSNTDKMLLSRLMSDRHGGMLHCNGIKTADGCLLLTGPSGTGKTTLSRMLAANGYTFIGDDVMLLSGQGDRFYAHGLWCHGSQPVTSPGTFPLQGILFLEQHTGSRITPLPPSENRIIPLLSAFMKPVLPKEGWQQSFDFLESVTRAVPCYRVRFNLSGDITNLFTAIWRPDT